MTPFMLDYRTVQPKELGRLAELREAVCPGRDLEQLAARDRERLDDDWGEYTFVCLEGQEVGALYIRETDPPAFRDYKFCLADLWLLPEYQHLGLGRHILAYVREKCDAWGHDSFCCACDPENEVALAFYRRMGGVEEAAEGVVWFGFRV